MKSMGMTGMALGAVFLLAGFGGSDGPPKFPTLHGASHWSSATAEWTAPRQSMST